MTAPKTEEKGLQDQIREQLETLAETKRTCDTALDEVQSTLLAGGFHRTLAGYGGDEEEEGSGKVTATVSGPRPLPLPRPQDSSQNIEAFAASAVEEAKKPLSRGEVAVEVLKGGFKWPEGKEGEFVGYCYDKGISPLVQKGKIEVIGSPPDTKYRWKKKK